MKYFSDYVAEHQNNHSKVAIVWGSGISVNSLNIDKYAPFLNIAVNASIMLFPSWSEGSPENRISVSLDTDAMHWDWFPTEETKCHRFLRRYVHPVDGRKRKNSNKLAFPAEMYESKNTYCFNRHPKSGDQFDFKDLDMCPYVNTAPLSIDLAIKTGAKLIALAGMEQIANKRGLTHFYQEWVESKQPIYKKGEEEYPKNSAYKSSLPRKLQNWKRNTGYIEKVKNKAMTLGIKIVRLSEQSALGFIPYMDEDSFISLAE